MIDWRPMKSILLAFCLCAPASPARAADANAAPAAAPAKKKKMPASVLPGKARVGDHPATAGENSEVIPRRDIPKALEQPEAPAPWLSWMLHPLKRGMWIRLPIMDTDLSGLV